MTPPETRVVAIDDPRDRRLDDYRGLTDAQLRRRIEHGRGLFVCEGELVIRAAIRSRYPLRSLLLTPSCHERLAGVIATLDAPVYVGCRAVLEAIVGFDIHRGAVALAGRLPPEDVSTVIAGARRLALLEGLNDHENLGAVFRNAAALGIDGLLLSPACADPLYRRSVRVSLGHVLFVPYARLDPWAEGLEALRRAGWHLVALTPDVGAEPVGVLDVAPARVGLLLGTERAGLSLAALAAADRRVRIPMAPGVDSLNVATAAAIAFQRLGTPPTFCDPCGPAT